MVARNQEILLMIQTLSKVGSHQTTFEVGSRLLQVASFSFLFRNVSAPSSSFSIGLLASSLPHSNVPDVAQNIQGPT